MLLGHGRRLAVRVEIALGHQVLQPEEVAVAQEAQLALGHRRLVIRLDEPDVVVILVRVRGDLSQGGASIRADLCGAYSPPGFAHLLLACAAALGIEMRMRVQVAAARLVVLDGHQRPEGHVPRHARIVQRVADEARLEGRAVEAVAVAAAIEHTQMDVEEDRVEQNRPDDERNGAARQLLHRLHNGLLQVAQYQPELAGRVQAHQQHHEQAHKLHAYRAGEHRAGEEQPEPPAARVGATGGGALRYLDHAPHRAHHEEQQYRIQQDILVEGQQAHICNETT